MRTLSHLDHEEIRDLLVGHRVAKAADHQLVLDDGTMLTVVPNEGCGGCTAGHYRLDSLNGCDNIITSVEFVDEESSDHRDDIFRVFVFAANEKINLLEVSGYDNGWYGTGYKILIRR